VFLSGLRRTTVPIHGDSPDHRPGTARVRQEMRKSPKSPTSPVASRRSGCRTSPLVAATALVVSLLRAPSTPTTDVLLGVGLVVLG